MKKLLNIVLFCVVCGLVVTINYYPQERDYLSSDYYRIENDVQPREVKFEGLLSAISCQEISVKKEIYIDSNIVITFFLRKPDVLDNIYFEWPTSGDDADVTERKLETIRTVTREIIYENNIDNLEYIYSLFGTDEVINFTVNHYSSVVKVIVSGSKADEDLIERLNFALQTDEILTDIYIGDIPKNHQNTGDLPGIFTKIGVDSMIQSGQYTGRGVKVGIAEIEGVINKNAFSGNSNNNNDYKNRNITIKPSDSSNFPHVDVVSMISVGNNGIARGSDIYSCQFKEEYLTWFIDAGVNVVNSSFGGDGGFGLYASHSMTVDREVSNAGFTYVASAGNRNLSVGNDNYVTWPGTAYNAITVGNSHDSTSSLHQSSSYREMSEYGGNKPNLVAPGNVITNAGEGSGTSFSAPQVAGCVALLMEEFPELRGQPHTVLSIVTSSASPMSEWYNYNSDSDNKFNASGLHNQIGSGLLNYQKMREAASHYLSIDRESLTNPGLISESLEFYAENSKRIRASLSWLANGTSFENFFDFDLHLYKKEDNGSYTLVKYIDGSSNNVEFLDYSVKVSGNYRLSVQQKQHINRKTRLGLSYVLIDKSIGGSTSGGTEINLGNEECQHSFINLGNVKKCTQCDIIRPAGETYLAPLKGMQAKEVKNPNNTSLQLYVKYSSPNGDYDEEFVYATVRPNESIILPDYMFSNVSEINTYFKDDHFISPATVVDIYTNTPVKLGQFIIKNDSGKTVNVWVGYIDNSSGSSDGDTVQYRYASNLSHGNTIKISVSTYYDICVWFEIGGIHHQQIYLNAYGGYKVEM